MDWNHVEITIGEQGSDAAPITGISAVINHSFKHSETIDETYLTRGFFPSNFFNLCFVLVGRSFEPIEHVQNVPVVTFSGMFKDLAINQQAYEGPDVHSADVPVEIPRYLDTYFHFFKSLYELYRFDPEDFTLQRPTVDYAPPATELSKRKVIICHDIPGGKNDDPYCFDDFTVNMAYRFEHWSNIDGFIYFGHYRLTVPPPSWVNQAHRNGAKIFGTLIFEWDDGAKECKDMLDGVVTYQGKVIDNDLGSLYFAEKIVEIAKYFKLEGYLMNFESDVPEDYVDSVLQFLEYLKMRLRDELGEHSELIWYDSVISTGKVRWQSALRE